MPDKSFLLSIDSKKIKYGLSRTKALLRACNNPERSLRLVQIVGTNGKGSTAAMLANVLINNNYNTGLFTSPHLVELNERIRINNHNIPDSFIEKFLTRYKKEISSIEPSFFEIMTALSLCYFKNNDVDIAILETGLGGRWDSVTAAKSKIIIFTPIDFDHIAILGNTLEKIAKEKGGAINNQHQTLISTTQHNIVSTTLNNIAEKKNNTIKYIQGNKKKFSLLSTEHEKDNANLVNFAMQYIKSRYALTCKNINLYIQNTVWPGRIQKIQTAPDIIFDVAHNSHSIQAFINYFNQHRYLYKKAFLIVGFENGKDIAQDLPDLYRPFDCIDCTETKIRHSMPAKILFNLYKPKDKVINYNNSPIDNIQNRTKNLKSNDILVILGSHYFGPHIKRIFKNCFDIKLKQ